MNIFDIAKETGFSIATVSRAINNSGYVSEKTRAKIMKVIEENNYSVNAFARGMATSSMSQVGIVSTDSRDIYQAESIYYLQNELKAKGYTSLLTCSGIDLKDKQQAISLLLSRNVDAIFLIGSQFIEPKARDNEYLKDAAKKVPVFLMNGALKDPNIYSIRCDDEAGSASVTRLVLENGAKNPLMIMRRRTYSSAKKMRGFENACKEAGIDPTDRILQNGHLDGMLEGLTDLLDNREYDALVCADDALAASAIKYCLHQNLRIPEDVQITGYNNSSLSHIAIKDITSYDNRIEYLCSTAVSLMNQVFDRQEVPADSVYTGKIIERESTRKKEEKPKIKTSRAEMDEDEYLF
ncbi:LacI family DNA-binding transcriptional regulator [Ileibacterium valens]|uniref:HTH lacI-type domain-containing protein n=1 Tax=Ileibacterium valens TaxID=1862668 RepID=A0A1U7NJ64_9FIRM|nr:LacI family DNA-binding transcriptional regulator [Ileibacterium valens]OLU38809.1 hypothetical protein BO224_08460 [Erysipelotrichaceae bacterium NYU-BL-E8]OLU39648.1 hypothetical protein BM735_07130 [Erysipelotrichaceae bacterium NYU-BL-F16]OLU43110.1 hypothetical protein BO222_00585 [Ileibacterium valens]